MFLYLDGYNLRSYKEYFFTYISNFAEISDKRATQNSVSFVQKLYFFGSERCLQHECQKRHVLFWPNAGC